MPLRITQPQRRAGRGIVRCPATECLQRIGAVIVRGEVYTSGKEGSMGV